MLEKNTEAECIMLELDRQKLFISTFDKFAEDTIEI